MSATRPTPGTRRTVVAGQVTAERDAVPGHRAFRFVSGACEVVDLVAVVLLGTLALSGFSATFTGHEFLVVGAVGVLAGALVAQLVRAMRWPFVAAALLGTAVFFVLGGGLALRSLGNAAFVPGRRTVETLADVAVHGWKNLLTTLPPVDGEGTLLVLPWLLGLVTGVLGTAAAGTRSRHVWVRALLPGLVPTGTLALVLLLGVSRPASLWVQGVCFAVVLLAWMTWRVRTDDGVDQPQAAWARGTAALVVLALAGACALPLSAPLAEGPRLLLRDQVEPPFEISQYPSPLAGFRRYVDPQGQGIAGNLHDVELFRVEGLARGDLVRFAALDSYDGMVWGATDEALRQAGGQGEVNDSFQRVSGAIDNPVSGRSRRVDITLGEGWSGVWLPVPGPLRQLEFEAGGVQSKTDSFRYNMSTSTAVVPAGLHPGDRYRTETVPGTHHVTAEDTTSSFAVQIPADLGFLDDPASSWPESSGARTPMEKVLAIAGHLRENGRYSDGVAPTERSYAAGHGLMRLEREMITGGLLVGNDEQYAALMALLAIKVGVPARVVLGAVVPESGSVTGADVHAWVELQLADGSWGTLATEKFLPTLRPEVQQQLNDDETRGSVVPPPAPIPPPSHTGEQSDTELQRKQLDRADDGSGPPGPLPWWARALLVGLGGPLLVLLAGALAVLGAKALRRRRRRRAPRGSTRIAGGWDELVDTARDLGRDVPLCPTVTRREQAHAMGTDGARGLARSADSAVFGPGDVGTAVVDGYWQQVLAERRVLAQGVGRLGRFRAAVALRSLRPTPRVGRPGRGIGAGLRHGADRLGDRAGDWRRRLSSRRA